MYNILVVDDEPMIGEGVAMALRGADLRLGDIYIARNGYEALDYIRLERVDLLITDIQMDRMSGLELIETMFAENWTIPVIVLSAHGEFNYAQKALRLGVKEYIIKPVVPSELIRITRQLIQERDQHLRDRSEAAFRQKYSLEALPANYDQVLTELLAEGMRESEVEAILEHWGRSMRGPFFAMLVMKLHISGSGFQGKAASLRDRNLLRYAARNVVEETLDGWSPLVFASSNQHIAVVLQYDQEARNDPESLRERMMIAQLVHRNLLQYLNMDSAIGLSRVKEGTSSWPALSREAHEALGWSDDHPGYAVFAIEEAERLAKQRAGRETDGGDPALQDNNAVILQAKQYIETHYRRKGLKLQEIASSVYVTPNYLSYLFKKSLGCNLWDYVTQLRMEEAKTLLKTTDMRRYEVSDYVGYDSPEHFGKLFKKYFGVNPTESR
ncbi:response regulator transcription factor [Paenibacillus methanolicus]|uniref:Two-component system response regulator YesN n=1 Tax=Paenibacillus methanolicus TaxID=582686 RepID=A0A5S5BY44_9BACL|nr:response regulator [Paenibacillus methanolicus]TYP71934.1 two-component system response regulator YesN [Paenibacillus methanolicus]